MKPSASGVYKSKDGKGVPVRQLSQNSDGSSSSSSFGASSGETPEVRSSSF